MDPVGSFVLSGDWVSLVCIQRRTLTTSYVRFFLILSCLWPYQMFRFPASILYAFLS